MSSLKFIIENHTIVESNLSAEGTVCMEIDGESIGYIPFYVSPQNQKALALFFRSSADFIEGYDFVNSPPASSKEKQ